MLFLYREKIDRYGWSAAVMAFCGTTILMRSAAEKISLISVFCLIGAAAFGLQIVLITVLGGKEYTLQF